MIVGEANFRHEYFFFSTLDIDRTINSKNKRLSFDYFESYENGFEFLYRILKKIN